MGFDTMRSSLPVAAISRWRAGPRRAEASPPHELLGGGTAIQTSLLGGGSYFARTDQQVDSRAYEPE
jgi:hypothetical protein